MEARIDALRILQTLEDPGLIRRWLFTGLLYPFWYLLTPAGATDSWALWWAVGGCFVGLALASHLSERVRRHLRTLHLGCCWLVTVQLFGLASVNDMHPFYSVGSILAVVATSTLLSSRGAFLAYGSLVVALTGVSLAFEASALKAAYWLPLPTILLAMHFRMRVHLQAVDLVREYQGNLERKVDERTRQLSEANDELRREMQERSELERKLRFSQKMEAVGRLAGGVAHDFNNLLTAIRGYADILLQDVPLDSPLRGDLDQLRRATQRSASLANQLLAFSRPEVTQLAELALNPMLLEMRDMLSAVLGEDVELTIATGEGPGRLRADSVQLEQVILNLVLNARDAMPDGGTLTIETSTVDRSQIPAELAEEAKEPCYVRLAVTDTGVGMDDDTRARLFEPFFTTKEVGSGTGLGLSSVYGIVTHAGGHIRVSSEPGKGSRFELLWPQVQGATPAPRPEPPPVHSPAGSERILLVEDEKVVRHLARRILERNGYVVEEAADGPSALRVLGDATRPIQLVVTDAVMPHMSGFELVDRVSDRWPETRVLLVSGHLDHPSLRSPEVPPDVPFLRKPFTPSELCASVREVLDR